MWEAHRSEERRGSGSRSKGRRRQHAAAVWNGSGGRWEDIYAYGDDSRSKNRTQEAFVFYFSAGPVAEPGRIRYYTFKNVGLQVTALGYYFLNKKRSVDFITIEFQYFIRSAS